MRLIGVQLVIVAVLLGLSSDRVINAQVKSATNLWTSNPRIRIAQFHVTFISAFGRNEANATKAYLDRIVAAFNGELTALSRDPRFGAQSGFTINTDIKAIARPVDNAVQFEAALAITENSLQPDDVAVVYILSHGIKTGQDTVQLTIGGGRDVIDRAAVTRRLQSARQARKTRLLILITDNCAEPAPSAKERTRPMDSARSIDEGGVWRGLYFGHEGFVHISTSNTEKGQLAFLDGPSLFALALRNALSLSSIADKLPPELRDASQEDRIAFFISLFDRNGDRVLSWSEFEPHLKSEMQKTFDLKLRSSPNHGDEYEAMAKQGGQDIEVADGATVLPPS